MSYTGCGGSGGGGGGGGGGGCGGDVEASSYRAEVCSSEVARVEDASFFASCFLKRAAISPVLFMFK
jgi:hypothetical protein